ncbi:MAG: hypothetical protein ACYC69_00105 [Thermodesulfovibrionales bacterium]
MESKKTRGKKRLSPWKLLIIALGAVFLGIILCYMLRILVTELL